MSQLAEQRLIGEQNTSYTFSGMARVTKNRDISHDVSNQQKAYHAKQSRHHQALDTCIKDQVIAGSSETNVNEFMRSCNACLPLAAFPDNDPPYLTCLGSVTEQHGRLQ